MAEDFYQPLQQLKLNFMNEVNSLPERGASFTDPAFATNKTTPIHRWVPWIAGFSSDFVLNAIDRYILRDHAVIVDPFCGVGTTLVEGITQGHSVIGFEINPYPYLATKVKISISQIDCDALVKSVERFRSFYEDAVGSNYNPKSSTPNGFQTRVPFFSPSVLRKVLIVQDYINSLSDINMRDLFRVAFASTMVSYSNYSYEPSLGTRASSGKKDIIDAPVGETIINKLNIIQQDVVWFNNLPVKNANLQVKLVNDSFFNASKYIDPQIADLIITSPPYLNNYHYNRNTRPQLYWLGYAQKPSELRPLEEANFGTYWQIARDKKKIDLDFELPNSDLQSVLSHLRDLHPEKGVYGGNGWANYAATYFNDCFKFAKEAYSTLKIGGTALIVVGNSILQGVMVPTDQYLAQIAESAGFKIIDIEIPRQTRVGSSIIQSDVRSVKASSKHQLYEAVVILQKK